MLCALEPSIAHGIDVDFKEIAIKTKKIETLSLTLKDRLLFDICSLDFINMLAVIKYLENDHKVFEECSRLLRPGGGLLITVSS